MRWTGRNFDAGREHHAWVVWGITVLVPALAGAGGLSRCSATSACCWRWRWNVAVLYLTLGFRQFSHYFTDIRDALDRGDETEARRLLAEWRHLDASELPRTELLRHVIEHSLLAAHRHVFGVFFWFVLLSALGLGPAGAVLYRMAEFASRYWAFKSRTVGAPVNERLMQLSQRLFGADRPRAGAPDGLRLRGGRQLRGGDQLLAARRRAVEARERGHHPRRGGRRRRRAARRQRGAGRHARPLARPSRPARRPRAPAPTGSTPGLPPVLGHLRSVVGLVWRSVVLWMLLLALLSLANLVG